MDALHYKDFDLDIDHLAGRHYPVRVLTSPAGQARATMVFPFDAEELKERLAALEDAVTGYAASTSEVQDFGTRLFDALFAGDIRLAYERSRQATIERGQGLRVRLRINAPELATLPWEFLFDPIAGDFLVLSRATALVRYLESPIGDSDKRIEPPIRILGMIASPSDAPSLDVAREQARLEQAIEPLRQAGQVDLTWLDGQTASALQTALQRGPWHVFHFVGHAAFDQATGEGTLLLADDQGRASLLTATQLSRLLADHPALQFVVLNACESARGSEQSLFSSTAAALVRHGLPAVLAMQYRISDRAAIEFTAGFYGALSSGLPIEAAVAEARKTLSLALPGSMEWGTPVLHMRMQSGQLFAKRPIKRRDFYTHIPHPDNYIPRPDLLAGVRAALLNGAAGLALTSSITVRTKADALHGMGGIGKSVAARALCDDPDVQAAFPDGILWAALGQTPDLLARLREWIDVLGGIVSENAPTVERMTAILADLLKERACLLIVDDVWKKAHVEPFRAGGARCRLLLTTRDAALADEVGATVHPVPVMAPDEAVALLEQWAGAGLGDIAAEIVRRLGYLPLAIRLAGAQLRRKEPAAWLAGFDAAKLAARRVEKVHDSLKATFDLSLDELSPEDRQLYVALAIFKEDELAPAVAIARLWAGLEGRDAEETTELLDDLAARALVQHSPGDGGAVTVHDLLRDFMETELGAEGRIAAHRVLLDAYRRTQQGKGWATAPDDGYLYDHLAYHLDAVADHDPAAGEELRSLFADQAWMYVRVPQSKYLYDGYLADLDVVWRRAHAEAHRQIDAGEEPVAIGDCVRYALIRTSINSLAANYAPELVARAVEVGLWPAERALSVAARVPHPVARAKMFAALLKYEGFSSSERSQAEQQGLAVALGISNEEQRAMALAALEPHLTGAPLEQGLAAALVIGDSMLRAYGLADLALHLTGMERKRDLEQELATARAIGFKLQRVWALAALAPELTGAGRDQALEKGLAAIQDMRSESYRAEALAALAPHLTGALLQQGLAAALAIRNEGCRTDALAALAPHLTGTLLEQGLAAALAIHKEELRARVLTALAPHLTGAERDLVLRQGLAAALAILNEWRRAEALAALAPHLTGAERDLALRQGLAAALAILNEWRRAEALAALAPHLTGALLERGLAAALAIRNGWCRAHALAALMPYLTIAERDLALKQGLVAALAIDDDDDRVRALGTLVPYLTDTERDRALEQGLVAALAILNEWRRAEALAVLAPHLTGADRNRALVQGLAAALSISYDLWDARPLAALTPHLTGALLAQGLAVVLAIDNEWRRTEALLALAPHLTGSLLEQGLVAALAIHEEEGRARVLAALAPQLAGTDRDRALEQGLTAALAVDNEELQARALVALAPHLTGALLKRGLAAALAIRKTERRARSLAALAPHLTGADRNQALEHGLAAALYIRDSVSRAQALAVLAPQLTGADRDRSLKEGLVATRTIRDEWERTQALAALAPHLTEALLEQGLALAQGISHKRIQASALAAFIPVATDQTDLVARILGAIVDHIYQNLARETRRTLLSFCSNQTLFAPPILSPRILADIAYQIIEICQLWNWT